MTTEAGKETGQRSIVTRECGCEYMTGGLSLGPVVACDEHRYMRCGKCGGRGEISPMGFLCPHCTFGGEIIPMA